MEVVTKPKIAVQPTTGRSSSGEQLTQLVFVRQCLKYWPTTFPSTPSSSQQSGLINMFFFSYMFLKDIWGSSITHSAPGRKCRGEEIESKPNIHFLYSNKLIFTWQKVCLSVCSSVTRWKLVPLASVLYSLTCKLWTNWWICLMAPIVVCR